MAFREFSVGVQRGRPVGLQLTGELETPVAAMHAQTLYHKRNQILRDNQATWRVPETTAVEFVVQEIG